MLRSLSFEFCVVGNFLCTPTDLHAYAADMAAKAAATAAAAADALGKELSNSAKEMKSLQAHGCRLSKRTFWI